MLENFNIFFTNGIRTRNGCSIKDNTFTMNWSKKNKKIKRMNLEEEKIRKATTMEKNKSFSKLNFFFKIKNFSDQLNNDIWQERKERGEGIKLIFLKNKIFGSQLDSDT